MSRGHYNQTGGNTLYDYGPLELVVTDGSLTETIANITLADPMDWTVCLGVAPPYIFNFNVTQEDGDPIPRATVTARNSTGDVEWTATTYANGSIPQQTLDAELYEIETDRAGYMDHKFLIIPEGNLNMEAPITAVNIELLTLVGTAVIFTLITLFTANLSLGIVAAVIGMVTWFATAGWWLVSDTVAPGISYLFMGFGIVCAIFILIGSFRYYDVIISRKEEPIL